MELYAWIGTDRLLKAESLIGVYSTEFQQHVPLVSSRKETIQKMGKLIDKKMFGDVRLIKFTETETLERL